VCPPADQEQIRNLIGRFTDAINRVDVAAFASVWTSEATWIIDPPTGLTSADTCEAIAAGMGAALPALWSSFIQSINGAAIAVDGDRATARVYLGELGVHRERGPQRNLEVYDDTLERTAEGWRFRLRHYHYLYLDESPITGHIAPVGKTL
jgi:ketosteroid isomerase-like protein